MRGTHLGQFYAAHPPAKANFGALKDMCCRRPDQLRYVVPSASDDCVVNVIADGVREGPPQLPRPPSAAPRDAAARSVPPAAPPSASAGRCDKDVVDGGHVHGNFPNYYSFHPASDRLAVLSPRCRRRSQ